VSLRYEEADESAVMLMEEIRAEVFPWTKMAHIKVLFDLRKRKKSGMLCLAQITKANEMLRFFTRRGAETLAGYDYVITVDKMAWRGIEYLDKVRILRHELRHICIDDEKPDPYMLIPHDVNDFELEIQSNQDDPTWGKRVAAMANAAYKNQELGLSPYQGVIPVDTRHSTLNPFPSPRLPLLQSRRNPIPCVPLDTRHSTLVLEVLRWRR
jgi:hypothetical protein